VVPERAGVVILDATSFSKPGTHSVGVAPILRHVGQGANCQVAVTAALWTGVRAWMLGAALYVPNTWLTDEARAHGKIPATSRFQEMWQLALTLLRQIRAAPAFTSRPCSAMRTLATMPCCAEPCTGGSSRMRSGSRRR